MITASSLLARAMKQNLPCKQLKRTKIFANQGKKTRYYFADSILYRKEYLQSEHWQNLRARKLQANPVCEICGDKFMVEPHHIHYRNLYDVTLTDLQSLCRRHHNRIHHKRKIKRASITKENNKILHEKVIRRRKRLREYAIMCFVERKSIAALAQ